MTFGPITWAIRRWWITVTSGAGSQFDTVNLGAYLPGFSQTDLTTDTTHYLHTDHLGSTWYMSGDDLTTMYRRAVRTGFGQHFMGTGSGPETQYCFAIFSCAESPLGVR
jgi:hypothetical protein